MTREEMLEIIKKINSAYPNFKVEDKQEFFNTWYECLGEYDFKAVAIALKNYIMSDTTGFAPTIGHINNHLNIIKEQIQGDDLNEMQAWALVSNALRNSAWHSEEEYAKLPPLVQKAVGSPQNLRNWATTDITTVENVIMSNFQRTYRGVVSQERSAHRMPIDVQHLIAQHQSENLRIGGGEDD